MRLVRPFLAFVVGLAAMAALLLRVWPGDQDAYADTVAGAHECQILFVGPSYLHVGLNLDLFQQETRRLGHELCACKFTRSALRSWELRHDIENLLAYRWPKLERVVVDISLGSRVGFEEDNWFNPRLVFWHAWSSLPWLVEHSAVPPFQNSPRAFVREFWPHVQHVAMNYLGVGRGATALGEMRVLDRWGGEASGETRREANRFVRKGRVSEKDYPAVLAGITRRKARVNARKGSGNDAWPRELEGVVRERGFEPVFLYSPVLESLTPPRLRRRDQARLLFLDFDDPARFPELYTYSVRGNTSHLNRNGAVEYSRVLARELVALPSAR